MKLKREGKKMKLMKSKFAKYISMLMSFVLMFSISAVDGAMCHAVTGIIISGGWLMLYGFANGVFDDEN